MDMIDSGTSADPRQRVFRELELRKISYPVAANNRSKCMSAYCGVKSEVVDDSLKKSSVLAWRDWWKSGREHG